jgi:REP-associated tyrosine transposase
MDEYESLSHTKLDCKYHVVFIPKWLRMALYGELRRHLGEVFKKLAAQKESRIEEGLNALCELWRAKIVAQFYCRSHPGHPPGPHVYHVPWSGPD